jgi:hypothetical protein
VCFTLSQKNKKKLCFTFAKKTENFWVLLFPKKQKTCGFYSSQKKQNFWVLFSPKTVTLVLPASFLCIPHQGVKD